MSRGGADTGIDRTGAAEELLDMPEEIGLLSPPPLEGAGLLFAP